MLEQLRQNSRSFIIWILFGIIIAVFIVSFGPQAGPDTLGCTTGGGFAVRVSKQDVSPHSWRFAYQGMALFRQVPPAEVRRHIAIDTVVERELLAQAAEAIGFRVSTDLVNERIQQGYVYIGGFLIDGRQVYYPDGVFDYDVLERFVNSSLSLPSVPYYIEEQRREILADLMRTHLMSGVRVSTEEARSQYIQENTKIKLDYVVFDPARYQPAMKIDEAALARYAADHADELKEDFERSKASYEKAQDWVRARHILIKKTSPAAPEPDPADGEEPKTPEKPKPDEPKPDEPTAKENAEAARARIQKGESFATVAADVSEDENSRARGGSLGWRPASSLGWGNELVEAAKTLEPGKASDVIESQFGFHILWIDEKTDKGLTFEQKKLDLAAVSAPRYYGKKRAEIDAKAAFAAAQGKNLADLYERTLEPASIPGQPSLSPEQMEELRRQMMEQMQNNPPQPIEADGETGWIIREGPNVLAQTGADEEEEQAAPKRRAPAREGGTTKAPSAAPQGPGVSPTNGAGRLASPPGVAGAAPAAPEGDPKLDEDVPAAEVPAANVQSVGPVARRGDELAGIGRSPELSRAVFDQMAVGALGSEVYEVDGSYFVIQLVSRTDADMDEFPSKEAEIKEDLRQGKGVQLLAEWLETRCRNAASGGAIEVSRDILYDDPDTDKVVPYNACQYITIQTIIGQQQSRLLSGLY